MGKIEIQDFENKPANGDKTLKGTTCLFNHGQVRILLLLTFLKTLGNNTQGYNWIPIAKFPFTRWLKFCTHV